MENNIRMILVGWTNDPVKDDSWDYDQAVPVELKSEQEILNWAESFDYGNRFKSIFLYEGPDYYGEVEEVLHEGIKYSAHSVNGKRLMNDSSSILLRELLFCPFENAKCLKEAVEEEEDVLSEWRKEIALEEGMLNGVNSYNDWMGW